MNELVHSAEKPKRLQVNSAKSTASVKPENPTGRTNDPARTMAGILEVATVEFGEKGLSGARIDEIAAATKTSKRMIYYYFGSKEGLYIAVLEAAYQRVRNTESKLQLDALPPEAALRELVGFTFDHHHGNPDYIRLVMTENIQRGAFLAQSKIIRKMNLPAISAVRTLYERGVATGVFRAGIEPVEIHAMISALSFFNVANRHTFTQIFKYDFHAPKVLKARREMIIDAVVRFVKK